MLSEGLLLLHFENWWWIITTVWHISLEISKCILDPILISPIQNQYGELKVCKEMVLTECNFLLEWTHPQLCNISVHCYIHMQIVHTILKCHNLCMVYLLTLLNKTTQHNALVLGISTTMSIKECLMPLHSLEQLHSFQHPILEATPLLLKHQQSLIKRHTITRLRLSLYQVWLSIMLKHISLTTCLTV